MPHRIRKASYAVKVAMNCLLAAVVTALSMLFAYETARADALPGFVERNDIAAINLQASAQVYSAGQPVLLRVGIKNISTQVYGIQGGAPWRLAIIVVRSAAGATQVGERDTTTYQVIYPSKKVAPGQTMWLKWGDDEWSDISHWGFQLKPGTYTITAIPLVGGSLATANTPASHSMQPAAVQFNTDGKTVNSNQITIQITQ